MAAYLVNRVCEEFFSSATVFVDCVKSMEKEPKPVDLIMFGFSAQALCQMSPMPVASDPGFTLAGLAALVGEHCQKPVMGLGLSLFSRRQTRHEPDWLRV